MDTAASFDFSFPTGWMGRGSIEGMHARVCGLIALGHLNPRADDDFVQLLHNASDTTQGWAAARLALYTLAHGFEKGLGMPLAVGPDAQVHVSFAGACYLHDRLNLLHKVLEAGPPATSAMLNAAVGLEPEDSAAPVRPLSPHQWAAALASTYDGCVSSLRRRTATDLFRIATEPLGSNSAKLLQLALQYCEEPAIVDCDPYPFTSQSASSLNGHRRSSGSSGPGSGRHGTAHFSVLHKALNGESAVVSLEIQATRSTEAKTVSWLRRGQPAVTPSARQCCELFIDSGWPAELIPGEPLDAGVFVLAERAAGKWSDVRDLMELYVERGLLDIDRPLSRGYRFLQGMHPLAVALEVGNGDAVEALIDMGCSTEAAAHERTVPLPQRPQTTASLTAALMRRQIREREAEADAQTQAPAVLRPRRAPRV